MIEYVSSTLDAVELANDIVFDSMVERLPVVVFINDLDFNRLENRNEVDSITTSKAVKIADLQKKKVIFCNYSTSDFPILEQLEEDWDTQVGGDAVYVTVPLFLF